MPTAVEVRHENAQAAGGAERGFVAAPGDVLSQRGGAEARAPRAQEARSGSGPGAARGGEAGGTRGTPAAAYHGAREEAACRAGTRREERSGDKEGTGMTRLEGAGEKNKPQ